VPFIRLRPTIEIVISNIKRKLFVIIHCLLLSVISAGSFPSMAVIMVSLMFNMLFSILQEKFLSFNHKLCQNMTHASSHNGSRKTLHVAEVEVCLSCICNIQSNFVTGTSFILIEDFLLFFSSPFSN